MDDTGITEAQTEQLRQLYYDPRRGLTHAVKLHKKTQGISLNAIKQFVKQQELGQLYKNPHKKKFYPITAPPDSYQADLIFMPNKVINNGYDMSCSP